MNKTIRDNIVLDNKFDDEKYVEIVEICELVKDFEQLTYGDQTEIGEKGINLSGGQKARVALARTIYEEKDFYLLDDPTSALDAHVKKKIIQNVILRYLKQKGKTVILVTNAIELLP